MHIIVLVKQVPDTSEVKINRETNTLIRDGVPSIINPYDRYAIEEALRIKESLGEGAGAESVRDAVHRCCACRIGHGTRLVEDPALMASVRDRGIPVEINLSHSTTEAGTLVIAFMLSGSMFGR